MQYNRLIQKKEMKNENNVEMGSLREIADLSKDELISINGGILPLILEAAAIYGIICAVSYGAGALYGLVRKAI